MTSTTVVRPGAPGLVPMPASDASRAAIAAHGGRPDHTRTPPRPFDPLRDGHRTVGRAVVPATVVEGGRIYQCDPANHRIDVLNAELRRLFSFGRLGSGLGLFNEPADVVIVYADWSTAASCHQFPILAVADRANHRVQLFNLDGGFISAIDPWFARNHWFGGTSGDGMPFFRVNPLPQLLLPSRLEWRAPYLYVTTTRRVVCLHLESAILPDLTTWLSTARQSTLRGALDHFLHEPHREVPASCLRMIADRATSTVPLIPGPFAGA